jgi:hypothetical protein
MTEILKHIITLSANSTKFAICTQVDITKLVYIATPQLTKETMFISNTLFEINTQHFKEQMVFDACIQASKRLNIL